MMKPLTIKKMMENSIQTIRCERCNELLNPKTAVWLELSITDGKYYPEGKLPEGHESQGGFSFGKACSKTQLKEDNPDLKWSSDDDKKYNETKKWDDIDPSQRR